MTAAGETGSTFVTKVVNKPGVCAGCQKILPIDYSGFVQGTAVVERGLASIRVCKDSRYTGRYPRARLGCLKMLARRVSRLAGSDIEGFAKSEVEKSIGILMLVVR